MCKGKRCASCRTTYTKPNLQHLTYIYIYMWAIVYIYAPQIKSRYATERRGKFGNQKMLEKLKLLDLDVSTPHIPFYSSQHALSWSGEFTVSVRSPSMAYDSWLDLSCRLVV